MVPPFFFTIFEGLPRQGPGTDACTARAFHLIPDIPRHARILDIGCGSGMQTLALARLCPGSTITATDIHQPFLDDLSARARNAALDSRITTLRASMDQLPFPEESFEIIWAEGSSFIIGFAEALSSWKPFLKPSGYLGISELFWFVDHSTEECRKYLMGHDPAIMNDREAEMKIRDAGYSLLGAFRLPETAWWDDFYIPLSRRVEFLTDQHKDDQEARVLLGSIEEEIRMFRKYSAEYGYSFFVMKKEEG
jgi:ubiquinone/menaquinone biosynthesis C-methylase UbiE